MVTAGDPVAEATGIPEETPFEPVTGRGDGVSATTVGITVATGAALEPAQAARRDTTAVMTTTAEDRRPRGDGTFAADIFADLEA
jgi:hypothetical protein